MIYTSESPNERPHVHFIKNDATAKVWIDEVEIVESLGFKPKENREILNITHQNLAYFIQQWIEIHGNQED